MLIDKLMTAAEWGARGVVYLLLLLSVVSMALIFERWRYFRRRRVDARALANAIVGRLRAGDRAGARAFLDGKKGLEADVLREALAWYEDGPDAVEQVLSADVTDRRRPYESGLLFLGTLGNNAPFLGLFGTVLGVITAFRELGHDPTGGAMSNVMTGIAEALIATAIGILVAVPAVIAYNVFQKRADDLEENVASIGGLLLAQMKSTRTSEAVR